MIWGVFLRKAEAENRAYSEILKAIVTQEYEPGDHLTEATLAEKLDMSRTPVRSALKKMIASGMLEYCKNIGYRIPVLTPQDMENVFQARIVLEAKTASLAAANATEEEIKDLFGMVEIEKEYYAKGDVAKYTKINESFHLGIATIAKNDYIKRFISQTFWRSELYIVFFDRFYHSQAILRDPNSSKSCKEHALLTYAISERDSEKAAELMRNHIISTYSSLTRQGQHSLL